MKATMILVAVLLMALLGSCSSDSNGESEAVPDDSPPELGSEEKEYLDQRIDISNAANEIVNDQLEAYRSCPGYCPSLQDRKRQNAAAFLRPQSEAEVLNPPDGYEGSHDAYLRKLDLMEEQVNSILGVALQVSNDEINDLVEQANEASDESKELLPEGAEQYYDDRIETPTP